MTAPPKSILIVVRSLPFHGLGGMEAVAWDLARAFQGAGLKVTVLTTACPGLEAQNVVSDVEIVCLPVPSGRYSDAWWRESLAIYEDRFQGRYDVIFSVSAGAMTIAATRGRRAERPLYISQSHGVTWSEMVSKLMLPKPIEWLKALYISNRLWRDRGYRKFDAMVAVGPRVLEDLNRWPTRQTIGDVPRHEIANGIDTNVFRYDAALRAQTRAFYGMPDDAHLILSACRLHPQKGVQHAIDGFAKAYRSDSRLRLLIAGSGPFEADLKAKAESLDLGASVVFSGAINRDRLLALYSAADTFLFTTTRVEGLPLNVIEALACGLPVIVSEHIVLEDQPYQYAVDPKNHDQVAEQLLALAAALPPVKGCLLTDRYWLSRAAKRYLDLFDQVASSGAHL